jgi:hypothetical protein
VGGGRGGGGGGAESRDREQQLFGVLTSKLALSDKIKKQTGMII